MALQTWWSGAQRDGEFQRLAARDHVVVDLQAQLGGKREEASVGHGCRQQGPPNASPGRALMAARGTKEKCGGVSQRQRWRKAVCGGFVSRGVRAGERL